MYKVIILFCLASSCVYQEPKTLSPAAPKACEKILRAIDFYTKKHKIDYETGLSQIIQESGCDHKARGKKGEVGLGQLRPIFHAHKGDIYHPYHNLNITFQYLRELYEIDFSISNALARYNAGTEGHKTTAGQRYAQKILERKKLL